jgi:SPP1 gp7 family putative phage head morphogenesis protein
VAKSSDYWQKRFGLLEDARNKTAKQTVQSVTPAFDQAQAQIEKEINAWYARFAKNNQISLAEAKKLLNSKELKEFRWDVQEYIKWGRQNAIDQKWMKELENASARFHISRLEALKIRTQNAAERAFGNELDQLDQMAARMYMDDYYHTAYEIQKGLGIGWDVAQIDQRKLNTILSKPWTTDKMTFSDRIWKSKTQLVDSLHTELTQMCVLGKSPDQAINTIAKRMNVSKHQAGRLVMTEAAYFGSVAQKDCFNELDVEKYEIVATLDSHTSEVCQQMDGQVFDMKDFQAGVTAPPFHVWCRSCTCPWFEDNDDGTRAARDADGKTYYVPADMKYGDWYNSFVNGGSKGNLTPVIDIDDLRKQLVDKELDFDVLKRQIHDAEIKKDDFESGQNNPFWKKFRDMSDDEYQKYLDDLKKQNTELTAEIDRLGKDMDRYYNRPARGTPEYDEWKKWKADNNIDISDLNNQYYKKYDERTAVRDHLNDALGFSNWKSKFAGKTTQDFIDDIDKLKDAQKKVQDEIDDLKKQIDDALKVQAEAAYNAKSLQEIKDEIIKKHENILQLNSQKQEFSDIIDGMTKEQANLYEKMSVNFPSNEYYKKGTGWYDSAIKRVQMDLGDLDWEKKMGRTDHGAWKVKFHEELHQMDNVLGAYQKSPFARSLADPKKFTFKFTNTGSVTGSKMIQAIDDDVVNIINHAIDVKNATSGTKIKHLKNLNRISSDAKDAFIEWLKTDYPSAKDRASISVFTDAVGMTTKANLHLYSHGFWGHKADYCRNRGKDGATSEVWAELCSGLLRNDQEMIDAFTKLMPNTVKVYSETLNEVMEWAKTGSFSYTP